MDPRLAACLLLTDVLTADGMILEPERALLEAAMERAGLDAEGRKRVADMDGVEEALTVVAALGEAQKREIVDELTRAALSDRQLSPKEIATIARITARIGL